MQKNEMKILYFLCYKFIIYTVGDNELHVNYDFIIYFQFYFKFNKMIFSYYYYY